MTVTLFIGDIADARVDALCSSTNPRLSLMMGTGGSLPAKIVIHCIASDAARHSSIDIVRSRVRSSTAAALQHGCTSIAMPVFATGHAPMRFETALGAMAEELKSVSMVVTIVIRDADLLDDARHMLGRVPVAYGEADDSASMWNMH